MHAHIQTHNKYILKDLLLSDFSHAIVNMIKRNFVKYQFISGTIQNRISSGTEAETMEKFCL